MFVTTAPNRTKSFTYAISAHGRCTIESASVRLVSLNAWQGRLRRGVLNYLLAENATIVAAQEITNTIDGISEHFDDWMAINGLRTPDGKPLYSHADYAPASDWEMMGTLAQTGQAIFSKHPLAAIDHRYIRPYIAGFVPHGDMRKTENHISSQCLQHVAVALPAGKTVNILNYHGALVMDARKGAPLLQDHCKAIADYIQTLTGPIILCGDFNMEPDATPFDEFHTIGLRNLYHEFAANIPSTRTCHAWRHEVVDHIFVSSDIKAHSLTARTEEGALVSDHAPLVLSFRTVERGFNIPLRVTATPPKPR